MQKRKDGKTKTELVFDSFRTNGLNQTMSECELYLSVFAPEMGDLFSSMYYKVKNGIVRMHEVVAKTPDAVASRARGFVETASAAWSESMFDYVKDMNDAKPPKTAPNSVVEELPQTTTEKEYDLRAILRRYHSFSDMVMRIGNVDVVKEIADLIAEIGLESVQHMLDVYKEQKEDGEGQPRESTPADE